MRNLMVYILFITIVLAIYFGVNGYVFFRLAAMLAIKKGILFYVSLMVMTLSFVAAMMLQTAWPGVINRILFIAAGIWLGVVVWLFCLTLLSDILRVLVRLPIPPKAAAIGILIAVILMTAYSLINDRHIAVRTLSVGAPVHCRIAHLSDIHVGSLAMSDLADIVQKTNELKPDYICITGDLVDNLNESTREALKKLNDFEAPVIIVSGNHDRYAGLKRFAEVMSGLDVQLLQNRSIEKDGIQIVGFDDSGSAQYLDRELAAIQIKPDLYKVLLFHRPDHPEIAASHGINLMLCGHTHRGQFFPVNFLVRSRFPYFYGAYTVNGMTLNVSSGTGWWGPPMRLGTEREIVLIDLGSKASNL